MQSVRQIKCYFWYLFILPNLQSSMTTAWFTLALWSFVRHMVKPQGEQILLSTNLLQMPKCQVTLPLGGKKMAHAFILRQESLIFYLFIYVSFIDDLIWTNSHYVLFQVRITWSFNAEFRSKLHSSIYLLWHLAV